MVYACCLTCPILSCDQLSAHFRFVWFVLTLSTRCIDWHSSLLWPIPLAFRQARFVALRVLISQSHKLEFAARLVPLACAFFAIPLIDFLLGLCDLSACAHCSTHPIGLRLFSDPFRCFTPIARPIAMNCASFWTALIGSRLFLGPFH